MIAPPTDNVARLNGVPVSPESARLLVHAVGYSLSYLEGSGVDRKASAAALSAALGQVNPFGPWNDVFAELKRIAGLDPERAP